MGRFLIIWLWLFAAMRSVYAARCLKVFPVSDANQARHDYLYNERHQLKQAKATEHSGAVIAKFDYTLGPTGLRQKITESGEIGTRVLDFKYDTDLDGAATKPRVYRMTEQLIGGASARKHGYDSVGNRVMSGSVEASFDYRDQIDNNTSPGTASTGFDANGNTISGGEIYDYENRVVVKGNVALSYDADGNRVKKSVGGVTTFYLIDDLNPTGYAQVVAELESMTAQPKVRYIYGSDLIAQNRRTAAGPPATYTTDFYGYDGHGSVRLLFNGTGKIVLAAGKCKIVKGEVKLIDNSSRHYRATGPIPDYFALRAFKYFGFDGKG